MCQYEYPLISVMWHVPFSDVEFHLPFPEAVTAKTPSMAISRSLLVGLTETGKVLGASHRDNDCKKWFAASCLRPFYV